MKYFLPAIFLALSLGSLLAIQRTQSFLSDEEKVSNNVLSVATEFFTSPTPTILPSPTVYPSPTPTPTPAPTLTPTPTLYLVINEVYTEGQAKGEWVEIYNPTSSSVDVSGWMISDRNAYENGQDDQFPTVSPIPVGGYAVVITNQSTVIGIPPTAIVIQLTSANIGSGLNDEGDAVVLKNLSNTIVDAMSYGDETLIFPTPPPTPGAGKSLARSPNGYDSNLASDWIINNSPSIGVGN